METCLHHILHETVFFTVQKTTKTLVIHTTVPTRIFKDRDLLLATSESFLTRMFQKCRIDTEQYELVKIGMDVKDIPHSSKKITGSKSTVSITGKSTERLLYLATFFTSI